MCDVSAIAIDNGHVVFPDRGRGRTIWEGVLTPKKEISAPDEDDGQRRPKRLRIELAMAIDYDSEPDPGKCNHVISNQ